MKIKKRYKTSNSNNILKPLLINLTYARVSMYVAFYPDFHSTASRVLNFNIIAFKESP